MIARIAGKPILPHPQKIARLWFPQYTEHTTPIHQDYVHFQGSFDTWTAWAPVGDCPAELGGLAVIPGSHKVNRVLDHHFSLGAGGLSVETEHMDGAWHTTDYEAGDNAHLRSADDPPRPAQRHRRPYARLARQPLPSPSATRSARA